VGVTSASCFAGLSVQIAAVGNRQYCSLASLAVFRLLALSNDIDHRRSDPTTSRHYDVIGLRAMTSLCVYRVS
jgi:hypothetical protein